MVLVTEPPVLLQYQFFKLFNAWNCLQVQWKSLTTQSCEKENSYSKATLEFASSSRVIFQLWILNPFNEFYGSHSPIPWKYILKSPWFPVKQKTWLLCRRAVFLATPMSPSGCWRECRCLLTPSLSRSPLELWPLPGPTFTSPVLLLGSWAQILLLQDWCVLPWTLPRLLFKYLYHWNCFSLE